MAGPNVITGNIRFDGEVAFSGTATCTGLPANTVTNAAISATAAIDYTKLAQRVLADHPMEAVDWRVWDALQTAAPTSAAADDLGLTIGTFGTNAVYISSGDLKAAGATTRYLRIIKRIPANYEAAETIIIRAFAGMVTTVADTSAVIDFQAYEIGASITPSADLVTTTATSINSLTAANKDFTLTATDLLPGDLLDIRMSMTITDAATATAVIGACYKVSLMCDTRG